MKQKEFMQIVEDSYNKNKELFKQLAMQNNKK